MRLVFQDHGVYGVLLYDELCDVIPRIRRMSVSRFGVLLQALNQVSGD